MSTYAVISDVHANLEAFNAVLRKIEDDRVDQILFLGDIVGYGPDPDKCVELLRAKADIALAGNHDHAAIGLSDIRRFNPFARTAIEWTRDVLGEESKRFLGDLPLISQLNDIFLVHGTPKEPEKWHYLFDEHDARISFKHFDEKICCVGHSHIPFIVEKTPAGTTRFVYDQIEIEDNNRYIINVGSVGQPRDGNPDAAYVLLKDRSAEIKRVSYDIAATQMKMRKAGLPYSLISRLSEGR